MHMHRTNNKSIAHNQTINLDFNKIPVSLNGDVLNPFNQLLF